ncbi:ribosome-associated translation inhibitor RaiA [Patescibacteria group bacterium]|nr:MAG: ribosome-associated translation inhibitor RaiA [Patescibacteria group bacterium]
MTVANSTRFLFRGVEIDDRTDAYIRKRLGTVGRLLDDVMRIEIEIDRDKKGKFRVEVMVKTPYKLYRAEETTISIEGSVDAVEDELKRQVKQDKEKIRTLKKRGRMSLKKKMVLDKSARFRK